jgi:GGDEF domain-containing protein
VSENEAIGTLYVHDPAPRSLDPDQLDTLAVLATAAGTQLSLRRHVDQLDALARRDALTGAANRRAMDETIERELHRSTRSGTPVALLMLDLDRFKAFNDQFGHPAGDLLLQRVAAAWHSELRAGDLLGRWGGGSSACCWPTARPAPRRRSPGASGTPCRRAAPAPPAWPPETGKNAAPISCAAQTRPSTPRSAPVVTALTRLNPSPRRRET